MAGAMTANARQSIRITANPNYCDPDDCISAATAAMAAPDHNDAVHFAIPTSFSNPTHIELPSGNCSKAAVSNYHDSATYTKRSHSNSGRSGSNGSNIGNEADPAVAISDDVAVEVEPEMWYV